MIVLEQRSQLLLVAAVLLFLLGIGLAVAQPGDLGGDDGPDEAAVASSTTSSTSAGSTSTTATSVSSSTTAPAVTTTSVAGGTGAAGNGGGSGTNGSGAGTSGAGNAGRRPLAATGGEAWALPALGLLVAAATTRRLAARR